MKPIKLLLWCLFISLVSVPFSFWIMHPEFTSMEIFVKYWWVYLCSFVAGWKLLGNG